MNTSNISKDIYKRNRYGIIAGASGIIINTILGIIKFILGLITNSISIIADALNNISDAGTSILTIIGFKLANKKPDKKHPYGYARYEYISGLIIAILMLFIGFTIAKESIIKIFTTSSLIINNITYVILII